MIHQQTQGAEGLERIEPAAQLRAAIEHAAHLLPAQGPIGVFVHHNTLHAFQNQAFERAVLEAADLFGAQPYLTEEAYRRELQAGRILTQDVEAVLAREPDAEVLPGRLGRRELRRLLMVPGIRLFHGRSLNWLLEEGGWLERFRDDLSPEANRALRLDAPWRLWKVCESRALPQPKRQMPMKRPRDGVLAATGMDTDEVVNPLMIRLCGAFLDQGIAYWPMPLREEGLLAAARCLLLQPATVLPLGLQGLDRMLRQLEGHSAEQIIEEMLDALDVSAEKWEGVIEAELLALPGWAGMIRQLEEHPELAPHERVPCRLSEFLALRLVFTAVAVMNAVKSPGLLREQQRPEDSAERAHLRSVAELFDVAQLTGLSSRMLAALSDTDLRRLMAEVHDCDGLERRRLFHLAYERRHERQVLLPLAEHRRTVRAHPMSERLLAQVFFCIDEREESLRRHLEEVSGEIETFGAAGFFGVAVDYRGLDDARGVSLCPVVVKPGHTVEERPVEEHAHLHAKRQAVRRWWARWARSSSISTRTLVRGWISTATLGFLSLFPLAARVLSPLAYARLMKRLNRFFLPEPRTELTFMREDTEGREAAGELLKGFSTSEKVERVASVLGPAGLRRGMARLVVVLGHGSTSLNNPYESAYCCGACGGYAGGPNARLFAAMANLPAVREGLRAKGIFVPEDTWFVGGYHDTCSDDLVLFDMDLVPASHSGDLVRVRGVLDEARTRSAHERTRRFGTVDWLASFRAGLRQAQTRSEHLAEPRPEYGHSTNAVAIVGRRVWTKGLFLDRRAFLISYDADQDLQNEALARVLGAVIPVCAGINLEYYFSTVDNERYGSGTKLPHNISGLVGVMNGYQGDLLTGLPLQTVEIHEPVRILFVVETTPERLISVIEQNPQLTEFLEQRWIRLATMDPEDGVVRVYRGAGIFEQIEGNEEPLEEVESSLQWYRERRDHLPLARIKGMHGPACRCGESVCGRVAS